MIFFSKKQHEPWSGKKIGFHLTQQGRRNGHRFKGGREGIEESHMMVYIFSEIGSNTKTGLSFEIIVGNEKGLIRDKS